MRRCFYHTDPGQNAVFHNFAIQIALTQYSGRSKHVWAFSERLMVFDETKRNETKQLVFDETKQSLTLEKSGNCSSAAPNTLDKIAVLFRKIPTPEAQ